MTPLTDTCVHHRWPDSDELVAYLPAGWREYVLDVAGHLNMASRMGRLRTKMLHSNPRYVNPLGADLRDEPPAAASSVELVDERLLRPTGIGRAILVHDRAMLTPALPNPRLAGVLVRAVNDWTIERWLERDERLYGAVLVPSQLPAEAAAEIRRVGTHPKMAAVLLAANGAGKVFGHPIYHPIYEAAAELDLPVILHRDGDAIPDQPSMPAAGGYPLTFGEYAVLAPTPLMTHLTSLVSNAVFSLFPTLRVYVAGAGITWLPGLLPRIETKWRGMRAKVPWIQDSPSETLRAHLRVSTYGLETGGRPGTLAAVLRAFPEFADLVCHGSGYPAWDTVRADEVRAAFPPGWHERILAGNAAAWFRWS